METQVGFRLPPPNFGLHFGCGHAYIWVIRVDDISDQLYDLQEQYDWVSAACFKLFPFA